MPDHLASLLAALLFCLVSAASADDGGLIELHGRAVQGGLIIGRAPPGAEVELDGEPLRHAADGFFLVGDATRPEPAFQKAMIDSVAKVAKVAEADENGNIIGVPIAQFGVINYPGVGLCGNHTKATYVSTTEVYPDSPNSSPEICNTSQVACVVGGLDYVLAQQGTK